MTKDVSIRKEGRAGRITLTRPKALNALNYAMCLEIDQALKAWETDADVALILIDAEGEKAFCAGGDIAEMYHAGAAGDLAPARNFWRDEYRMNARLADYPKPIVSFLQGFTMGGGVGLGGHVSHRVVGGSTQISMPECGIGLVPDVGGTLILARAPGQLGAYIGLTGARLNAGDAILAGFADYYLPEDQWEEMKTRLVTTGTPEPLTAAARPAPAGSLDENREAIDRLFAPASVPDIFAALTADGGAFAAATLKTLRRNSPLSMAATLQIIRSLAPEATIQDALRAEYRFTWRSQQHSDFQEGVRAAIIDKDRQPAWRHSAPEQVSAGELAQILAPLGADELTF